MTPQFELLRGSAAVDASALYGIYCFQHPAWVSAVAVARQRPHEFIAIRARLSNDNSTFLFGAIHRRWGMKIFESMPMGGYGGWCADQALNLEEEKQLNRALLSWAPWSVMEITSAPDRGVTLPKAVAWPLPKRLRQRVGPHDSETHVLDLKGDDATLLQRVRSSIRSYLRKVDQLGFSFNVGDHDQIAMFCDWYRRGSQDWKNQASSILPDEFFAALNDGASMEIWSVSKEGRTVGAAVFLLGRSQVQYQASGCERLAGPVSAMDALIWAAAKHYRDRGFQEMNLGASEGLDSVRRFKEKFGAHAVSYRRSLYLLPWVANFLGLNTGRRDE